MWFHTVGVPQCLTHIPACASESPGNSGHACDIFPEVHKHAFPLSVHEVLFPKFSRTREHDTYNPFQSATPWGVGGNLKQNQVSAKLGLFPLEPLMVDVFSMFSIDGRYV